jgi:alkylhydroperoxidase family enzyme
VRWQTTLEGRLREIVINRMGHLTNSQYVLPPHVPSLALAEGLSLDDCNALAEWDGSNLFSDRERAALAYTDTMTRDIVVPDEVFAEVERHFDPRHKGASKPEALLQCHARKLARKLPDNLAALTTAT